MNLLDLYIWPTNLAPNNDAERMEIAEPSRVALRQLNAELSRVQQELGDLIVDIKRAREFAAPADMEEWVFLLALMESRVVRINHAVWSLVQGEHHRDPNAGFR